MSSPLTLQGSSLKAEKTQELHLSGLQAYRVVMCMPLGSQRWPALRSALSQVRRSRVVSNLDISTPHSHPPSTFPRLPARWHHHHRSHGNPVYHHLLRLLPIPASVPKPSQGLPPGWESLLALRRSRLFTRKKSKRWIFPRLFLGRK